MHRAGWVLHHSILDTVCFCAVNISKEMRAFEGPESK